MYLQLFNRSKKIFRFAREIYPRLSRWEPIVDLPTLAMSVVFLVMIPCCKGRSTSYLNANDSQATDEYKFVGSFFNDDGEQSCSGSAVKSGSREPRCVLTATHCVDNARSFTLDHDLKDPHIKRVKVLRSRSMPLVANTFGRFEARDLSLVWLESGLSLSNELFPILATLNDIKVNAPAVGVGYGASNRPELSQKHRQKIDVFVDTIDFFNDEYSGARINVKPQSGVQQGDDGDSGGALIIGGVLAGVTSTATFSGYTTSYASISHSFPWISKIVANFCKEDIRSTLLTLDVLPKFQESVSAKPTIRPIDVDPVPLERGRGEVEGVVDGEINLKCGLDLTKSHCETWLDSESTVILKAKDYDFLGSGDPEAWTFSHWDGKTCPCAAMRAARDCEFNAVLGRDYACIAHFKKNI